MLEDPIFWLFAAPGLVLGLYAQSLIKANYVRYSQVPTRGGISQEVYNTPSLASAGIAAHEAGHALQDADDYFPMELRSYIVPIVQLSSKIAPLLFFGGYMLGVPHVAWAGVVLFGTSALFTLSILNALTPLAN